jgi:Beta-lactamase
MRALVTAFLLAFVVTGAQTQHFTTVAAKSALSAPDPRPSPAALISRAKALELDTPYVAPPGDPLLHHAAGFAKVMCSAVFISGLDPDFAAENVGYFTAPYEMRAKLGKPVVDREHKQVHVAVPGEVTRTAVYLGDQGCVTLPVGQEWVSFKPVMLKSSLPDASKQAWPMGDVLPDDSPPSELDMAKVKEAVDAAFDPPEAKTAALVVTWKGRLIAERYAPGITAQTPLESWSMGKSVTATLMGALIQQGAYELWQPAPIPEWQEGNDLRSEIRMPTCCICLVGSASRRLKIPITILPARIRTTCTCTPAGWTRSIMRPPGRCNGSRERSGGIATPTRS